MSIRKNLQDVQARIESGKSGRSESDVQLLGVTKYAWTEVQELVCLGVTQLGKADQDAKKRLQLFPNVKWHLSDDYRQTKCVV